jgi:hypothetical protein
MRVEDLRSGTLVNGKRVTGKTPSWRNGLRVITVTFDGDPADTRTYNVGQNVPGSPRLAAAFLPASNTRKVHDGHRGRNLRPDLDETAEQRRARRNALRLALVA